MNSSPTSSMSDTSSNSRKMSGMSKMSKMCEINGKFYPMPYSKKGGFLQTIQNVVINLAFENGIRAFTVKRNKVYAGEDLISDFKILTGGSQGQIYLLTYFDIILKHFLCQETMFIELSFYELIGKVYTDPERMGLPTLLGHGQNYILIPNYSRILHHNETDEIMEKVGECIYNLHRLGIVHRDIKFSNIMVHYGIPILIDFGLSSWKVVSCYRTPMTTIQTIWFRAPEVAYSRKRRIVSDFPMDWWSYGVILSSRDKMILTPEDNDDLIEQFEDFFDEAGNSIEYPENKFLVKNPSKRFKGSDFLKLPAITSELLLSTLPVADNLFKFKIQHLPNITSSWTVYFTAVDYLYYCKDEYIATEISEMIVGGHAFYHDACEYFDLIEGNAFRLNTFSILGLKYPIEDLVFHCFVLSLEGVKFSHQEQAKWIENTFINESDESNESDMSESQKDIEMHYNRLKPRALRYIEDSNTNMTKNLFTSLHEEEVCTSTE